MRFNIMDQTGHTTVDFTANQDEVAKAMAKFNELTKPASKGGKGMIAAMRTGPGKLQHIRAFDPNAEEIVFSPALKGG